MNNEPKQRKIKWVRTVVYMSIFVALIGWEVWATQTEGRPIQWVWVGIAGAGMVMTFILRVVMRV